MKFQSSFILSNIKLAIVFGSFNYITYDNSPFNYAAIFINPTSSFDVQKNFQNFSEILSYFHFYLNRFFDFFLRNFRTNNWADAFKYDVKY